MSAASAPFGFRPAYSPTGLTRGKKYTIASAYGTAIYAGQPVILNANGTITVGTAAADILGIFQGCEYVDSTGKPNVSTYWPAATTVLSGTTPVAWVVDDPDTVFEVQSDGSVAATAIGDQADVSNATANSNGRSQATLSSTLAGAGVQAQFRIIGFGQAMDNVPADAYTVVQVKIARHQFVSNKVAI
jgi:hypothetical protein